MEELKNKIKFKKPSAVPTAQLIAYSIATTLFTVAAILQLYGFASHENPFRITIISISYLLFSVSGLVFCVLHIRSMGALLIFIFSIFIFGGGRLVLQSVFGFGPTLSSEEIEQYIVAGRSLSISITGLVIGGGLLSIKYSICRSSTVGELNSLKVQTPVFQILVWGLCLVIFGSNLLLSLESYSFIKANSYAKWYSDFSSTLPFGIASIAKLSKPLLIVQLGFLPSIKKAIPIFTAYVISVLPVVIVGKRGDLVAIVILFSLYVFIRYYSIGKAKFPSWKMQIGIFAAISVAVIPILLWFDKVNYARFGQSPQAQQHRNPFLGLLYDQGITLVVLGKSMTNSRDLDPSGSKHYAFGFLIDQIKFGSISQLLFGTEPLGRNNLKVVELGNSLADDYSYHFFPKQYLQGRGSGSSYIAEFGIEFGYWGIFAISLLLGAILVVVLRGYTTNWTLNSILLSTLLTVFFLPRATTFSFLSFVFSAAYWAIVLIFIIIVRVSTVLDKRVNNLKRKPINQRGKHRRNYKRLP